MLVLFLFSKIRLCLHKATTNFLSFQFLYAIYSFIWDNVLALIFLIYNDIYLEHTNHHTKHVKDPKNLYKKTIIKELGLLKKIVIIQWNIKRRKTCFCLQWNYYKQFLMLLMLKHTINLIWREKTQNWQNNQKINTQQRNALEN